MIGGEGEANATWMVEGQWIEYAKQYKALCFQLEHRFYGKSHPTSYGVYFIFKLIVLSIINYFIVLQRFER